MCSELNGNSKIEEKQLNNLPSLKWEDIHPEGLGLGNSGWKELAGWEVLLPVFWAAVVTPRARGRAGVGQIPEVSTEGRSLCSLSLIHSWKPRLDQAENTWTPCYPFNSPA